MKRLIPALTSTATKTVLVSAVFAGATGVAFAAWVDQGGRIFMTMVDTGLTWCL